VLTMGNSTQRPGVRFRDFEVNLETGEVWKAGRPLKVQDQPFKVLAALLERPGEIVTREELRQPDKRGHPWDRVQGRPLSLFHQIWRHRNLEKIVGEW
jgi:hypothetical protein